MSGTAREVTTLERALTDLARATVERPARLEPADLDPLRALVGDGAIDYVITAGAFHFINRIADLLHVDPEALPASLRRFDVLRRLSVRVASLVMARMDLANRDYPRSYEDALAHFERATGRTVGDALAAFRGCPKGIEMLELAIAERDQRSTVDRTTLGRIHRTVEAALPAGPEEIQGFHARPTDPVEAFVFVGTRYARRTTEDAVAALRGAGWNDLGILDLATAVADANQWARMHRLLGLAPDLFWVDGRARVVG